MASGPLRSATTRACARKARILISFDGSPLAALLLYTGHMDWSPKRFRRTFTDALARGRSVTDALAFATRDDNPAKREAPIAEEKLSTSSPEYERELSHTGSWLTLRPPSEAKGSPGNVPENTRSSQRVSLGKYSG